MTGPGENSLEVLLSAFRRHNTCCKSVTTRHETICIAAEAGCLTKISSFFMTHEMQVRRTPNGLEFSVEDLARAVEIYEQA